MCVRFVHLRQDIHFDEQCTPERSRVVGARAVKPGAFRPALQCTARSSNAAYVYQADITQRYVTAYLHPILSSMLQQVKRTACTPLRAASHIVRTGVNLGRAVGLITCMCRGADGLWLAAKDCQQNHDETQQVVRHVPG